MMLMLAPPQWFIYLVWCAFIISSTAFSLLLMSFAVVVLIDRFKLLVFYNQMAWKGYDAYRKEKREKREKEQKENQI